MPADVVERENCGAMACRRNDAFSGRFGRCQKCQERLAFDELFELLPAAQLNKKKTPP